MDSIRWHNEPLDWASYLYCLLAPRVNVRGRMALILFLAVAWAVGWLLWRAYCVVQTPNDILVDKLGLDIPPAPLVTLEEISAREIQLSWKNIDPQNSVLSHIIKVNGKIVGETKRSETTVTILNLTPNEYYDIRVFAVSATTFETPSAVLHVKTSPAPDLSANEESNDGTISIRAHTVKASPQLSATSAPAMGREQSGGHPLGRRGTGGRRVSPAHFALENTTQLDDLQHNSDDEVDGTIAQLSERFQKVQNDNEATETQILEEEREFETATKDLEKRREELKQSLKERDDASSDLRKQVHKAETASRTAQNEKFKKERLLQQRESQRKKKRDEIARWEDQISSMAEEMTGIETQKAAVKKRTKSEMQQVRRKVEEEQREVKALDDENKEKALQIKALEEERKQLNVDEETEESREADRLEHERDQRWQEKLNNLTATYRALYHSLQQAQVQYDNAKERLQWTEIARRAQAASFAPMAPIDMDAVRRGVKPRTRPRHTGSLTSSVSSPRAPYGPEAYVSANNGYANPTNTSPTVAGPSFFNKTNGMTLVMPAGSPPVPNDDNDLAGGAPMSPRADALLPADLLGDDAADDLPDEEIKMPTRIMPTDRSRAFSNLRPRSIREDEAVPDESSPISASSRSFSSPHDSVAHMYEPDRASIRSNRPSLDYTNEDEEPESNSKKLKSSLFTFNRHRGKTSADEPPVLGSLKAGQSQSFPRKFGEELEPGNRGRRLSYGGNWAFNPLPRASTDVQGKDSEKVTSRRGIPSIFSRSAKDDKVPKYDPFGPRHNSLDPTIRIDNSSPRPSSTYSFDKLPRPSMESQFRAWGPERSGLRGSPLGPDWGSTHSWSQNQSRRPSVHHGSTSNLSIVMPTDEIIEDGEVQGPLQAPIGTRPTSSQRPGTPKLNPAAKSFTMLFNRAEKNREKDETKESKKLKKESKDKSLEPENASPPDSRKSKDTSSLTATQSIAESRTSLERSTSGLSEGTAPDSTTTTPSAKPNFISKITRKASSNKFGSWKDKSGGLFSRKGDASGSTPTGEPEEDTGSFEQLAKSLESVTTPEVGASVDKRASRTSLTWSFMKRSKRKEDVTASEVSENSERASEVGEEDEE